MNPYMYYVIFLFYCNFVNLYASWSVQLFVYQIFLFKFLYKIAADGHFGWPKNFQLHFSTSNINIQVFFFNFVTKWPPAILDNRKLLSQKSIGFFHSRSSIYICLFVQKYMSMAVSNINVIRALVAQLYKYWRLQRLRMRWRRRLDQNHNIPEISNFGKFQISGI